MITEHVVVHPYNEQWEKDFQSIRDELEATLDEVALRIEHIGSTAVKGLSAKPIIDIDVVAEKESVSEAIHRLETVGYYHEGDLGISGREAFAYNGKEHLCTHHLYVCPPEVRRTKKTPRFP